MIDDVISWLNSNRTVYKMIVFLRKLPENRKAQFFIYKWSLYTSALLNELHENKIKVLIRIHELINFIHIKYNQIKRITFIYIKKRSYLIN